MSASNTPPGQHSSSSSRSRSQLRSHAPLSSSPKHTLSRRSHSEVRRKKSLLVSSSPEFGSEDRSNIEFRSPPTTHDYPSPVAPTLVTLHNCRFDKNKNPLVRLTRLLIEDTKLAEIERVGEAVVKEDITNVIESTTHDVDGDALMEEQSVIVLQRRNSRSGSHLNPSFQQFSPCTSATSSTSPSPTKPSYYSSPYYIPANASPIINTTSSPLALYAPLQSPKANNNPTSPQAYSSTTTSSQRLKRPRASSMTDSNTSSRASSTSSTCRRSLRQQKRARTSTSIVAEDPADAMLSTPVSPCLLARASNGYPSRSWMLSNASRQVPQLLNIQGASLAFSKMELDHPSE